jgi:hypothetical protein
LLIQLPLNIFNSHFRSSRLAAVIGIPPITKKPTHKIQAVTAGIILEVTTNKLVFHRGVQLLVPAPLRFDDDFDYVKGITGG